MDDEEDLHAFKRKRANIAAMDYLEYKGYKGTVEYSREDDCLVGKVIGMSQDLILYEGDTLEELKQDFKDAVESYLQGCREAGREPRKPFSGKLILRMSPELHEQVTIAAASSKTTINEFINRTLTAELSRA